MKILPLEMKKHGFLMKQIKRSEKTAMYSKAGGFEVMVVRKHDGYKIGDTIVEPAEFLPGDEDFGRLGWYFSGPNAVQDAENKYKELENG